MKKRLLVIVAIGSAATIAILGISYCSGRFIPNQRAAGSYSIRGVDVSHHQGAVDWPMVASDGVGFAYIKATEGGDFRDDQFPTNWRNTATARITRGAYHFFTFRTAGALQADNFISTVPVDSTALPPAVDLEFWGNSNSRPTVSEFQSELSDLLSRLRHTYSKEPVIYTTDDFFTQYLSNYPVGRLWIRNTIYKPRLPAARSWLFWQFTDKARIRGIQTLVDLNVFAGDHASLNALTTQAQPSP